MPITIPLPASDTAIIIDNADYAAVSVHGWCLNGSGYVVARIDQRTVQLSRWLLDAPKGTNVIHRNGNRYDFRRKNLRIVTRSEAMQRQRKRAGTTSQYKGVQRHKKSGRWRATLWRGELRRNLQLGYFESEMEAAKAYDEAARTYYGEDAWVNFG